MSLGFFETVKKMLTQKRIKSYQLTGALLIHKRCLWKRFILAQQLSSYCTDHWTGFFESYQAFSGKAVENASPIVAGRKDVWSEKKKKMKQNWYWLWRRRVERAGEEANQRSRKHPLRTPHWTSTDVQCATHALCNAMQSTENPPLDTHRPQCNAISTHLAFCNAMQWDVLQCNALGCNAMQCAENPPLDIHWP